MATAIAVLTGCSSLPPKESQQPSEALREISGTALERLSSASLPHGKNGFKLLIEPQEALGARLALIRRAERTLDLQYFIWNADASGGQLLEALRDAALRGVRVRLLLDDLYTSDVDRLLESFSGFPGVEVRLFNPFPNGRESLIARLLGSLGDISRIRHRMHNKLFVADNVVAITGGRNIGDGYLIAGEGQFYDVDLLAMGPMVREMSESFDDYWNSDQAFDGSLIWRKSPSSTRRENFDAYLANIYQMDPDSTNQSRNPHGTLLREIIADQVSLQTCEGRFHADPVEKAVGVSLIDSSATVHERLIYAFSKTETDLHIVSPYFVRGEIGLKRIKALRDRGVRIHVLTNSLSTTDEPLAHVVYLRYRHSLMKLGVRIRELVFAKAAGNQGEDRPTVSASRLHAKLAIIDHRYLYVGSLNFTSRSERVNTELGLILDCPELASDALKFVTAIHSYELRLAKNGSGIDWVDKRESIERIWDFEPEVSIWKRLKLMLLGQFVPEEEI